MQYTKKVKSFLPSNSCRTQDKCKHTHKPENVRAISCLAYSACWGEETGATSRTALLKYWVWVSVALTLAQNSGTFSVWIQGNWDHLCCSSGRNQSHDLTNEKVHFLAFQSSTEPQKQSLLEEKKNLQTIVNMNSRDGCYSGWKTSPPGIDEHRHSTHKFQIGCGGKPFSWW